MIPIPTCRLLLAPADGHVRRMTAPDTAVASGELVVEFDSAGRTHRLTTPTDGTVGGDLVDVRRSVAKGTPVAWVACA